MNRMMVMMMMMMMMRAHLHDSDDYAFMHYQIDQKYW
jgi:hypothetical protein